MDTFISVLLPDHGAHLAVLFDAFRTYHTFRAIDVPKAAIREDFTDPQNRFYGACSQRSGKVNSYGFGEVGTSVVEQTVSGGEERVREKSSAV